MPKVLMGPGPLATTSAPGQMSAADKTKLDGIMTGANKPVYLTYGISTWNDFITAYNAGQSIYCWVSNDTSNPNLALTRLAHMTYMDNNASPSYVEFHMQRSLTPKTTNQLCDNTLVYKLTNTGVWTASSRYTGPKTITANTGLTSTFENDGITISGVEATTSQAGMMSSTDKIKLDGITTMVGATSLAAGTSGLVPAPTTSDPNNYLRGDGTWNQPVVILTYGVSTYQECIDAFNAGAMIYCKAPTNTTDPTDTVYTRYAALSYINVAISNPEVQFLYYRSRSHSSSTLCDECCIYAVNSNSEWSSRTAPIGPREISISGDGLSTSWNVNVLTFTTSAFTGATSLAAGTSGMVPAPTTTDVNKFLCGDGTWATISGSGTPASVFTGATSQAAGTSGLVPAPTTSDTTKFLRGDGTWAAVTGSGGITGVTLASTSLTPDANGVVTIPAMTGCSSSAAGATGIVPAPSSGDQDKFLAGDGTWKAGGLPMVILKYGISTWSDFINAYNNNVIVYCRASSNSDPSQGNQLRMAFMAYVNDEASPSEVEFQYYRSVSSHTSSNMCDQIFVYKLHHTNGWSVTSRYAGLREIINNSTAVSLSYSSNKITITDA